MEIRVVKYKQILLNLVAREKLLLICMYLLYVSSVGLPDGVSNLASEWKNESLSQVIRLTWDAPFSLDITGVDPDIWYRVDVTVDNNYFSTYDDINVTQFNFTMADYNNTSTRVIYEFRVTPINSAGDGITSDPVTGYFIGCKLLMW